MFNRFAALISMQLERELTHASEHRALLAERATSELREQFIASFGHDLRNPLAAIASSGEILARKSVDPLPAGVAQRITTNVRRMSALIDDVLDFARGRLGGGIGVNLRETADVETALNAVITELREAQPLRRISAKVHVSRRARCDLGRIQQLTSNLLGNALIHGAASGIVEFTARVDGNELVLDV